MGVRTMSAPFTARYVKDILLLLCFKILVVLCNGKFMLLGPVWLVGTWDWITNYVELHFQHFNATVPIGHPVPINKE